MNCPLKELAKALLQMSGLKESNKPVADPDTKVREGRGTAKEERGRGNNVKMLKIFFKRRERGWRGAPLLQPPLGHPIHPQLVTVPYMSLGCISAGQTETSK